jgi:hypothetical protein
MLSEQLKLNSRYIGLLPEIKYPTQYCQGVQALRHILSLDYKPSDVAIPLNVST